MNGPLSMYKLKPLVNFPDKLNITSTMYKMKNILYGSQPASGTKLEKSALPDVLEQVNKMLKKPGSEIEILLRRQEAILKQLSFLKEQMFVLREELTKKDTNKSSDNKTNKDSKTTNPQKLLQPTWNGVIGEIVLHASPENPPYSLLAVNQLWPDVLRVRVTCHAHSSVSSLPASLDVFAPLAATPQPTLSIRLIWKTMGPDCEMVISPLTHCPIRGEVNLLRYLQRSIEPASDATSECQLDRVLDTSHQLSHSRTQRDKQLNVRALNAQLGKTQFLVGDSLSVVDLAAWSVLQSLSGVDLSQNMSKWQQRITAALGVEAA